MNTDFQTWTRRTHVAKADDVLSYALSLLSNKNPIVRLDARAEAWLNSKRDDELRKLLGLGFSGVVTLLDGGDVEGVTGFRVEDWHWTFRMDTGRY